MSIRDEDLETARELYEFAVAGPEKGFPRARVVSLIQLALMAVRAEGMRDGSYYDPDACRDESATRNREKSAIHKETANE